LTNAAKIAGFKRCTLVSESVALALSYGFFRRKEMFQGDHEARTVVLIDVGHTKTTLSIIWF
jgi:molecular chaperone DnaK (HSP70)